MITTTPHYIPAAEQIHKNAAKTAKNQTDFFTGCAEMMQLMANSIPNPPAEAQHLIRDFTEKAIWAHRDAQAKHSGILNAQRVTQYYETPIMMPDFPYPVPARNVKVNHKELLMLTGYFDPMDKSADFKPTWQKLYDYGGMKERCQTGLSRTISIHEKRANDAKTTLLVTSRALQAELKELKVNESRF